MLFTYWVLNCIVLSYKFITFFIEWSSWTKDFNDNDNDSSLSTRDTLILLFTLMSCVMVAICWYMFFRYKCKRRSEGTDRSETRYLQFIENVRPKISLSQTIIVKLTDLFLPITQIKFEFWWHHFNCSRVISLYKRITTWLFCFPSVTLVCLNRMFWNW